VRDRRKTFLAWAFNQLQHPVGTSRMTFQKYLGLYVGNGNHINFDPGWDIRCS